MAWCVYCGEIPKGHRPPCPRAVEEDRRSPGSTMMRAGLVAVVVAVVAALAQQSGDDESTRTRTAAGPPSSRPGAVLPATRPTAVPVTAAVSTTPPTTRPVTTTTTNPCSGPDPGTSRPETGTELRERAGSGRGSLEVRNGTQGDAVVKLVTLDDPPQAVLAVFVRASESTTISAIPRRTYRLVFLQGSRWSDERGTFSCPKAAKEFEETFDFAGADWEVTLYGVPGGTAQTDNLDPKVFDSY